MLYSIREISQRLGIAPSALRYYEKEGILPVLKRSDTGVRQFSDIDLEWLIIIDSLKKTGMPLKRIKEFVAMFEEGKPTNRRRLEIIQRHKEVIKKQVEELNEILRVLEFKEKHYQEACKEHGGEPPQSMGLEDLPPAFQSIRRRLRGD